MKGKSVGIRRYLVGSAWLMAENVARIASGLIVSVMVARYLGPEGLGQLSYAQSIVGIVGVVVSLGLEGVVVKELIHDPQNERSILGSSFISIMLSGAMSTILLIVMIAPVAAESEVEELLIMILSLALPLQSAKVIGFLFQAKAEYREITQVSLSAIVISTVLRGLLVLFEAPLIAFAIASIVDAILNMALMLAVAHRKKMRILEWRIKGDVAINLLKQSWPLLFAGLLVFVFMRIDQIMIKNMLGAAAAGVFAVAARILDTIVIVPASIVRAVNPALISSQKEGGEIYRERLQILYDIGVILSVVGSGIVTLAGGYLIQLLFGDEYAESKNVLALLVWSSVVLTIGQINAMSMIAERATYQTLIKAALGTVVNVILNYYWIKKYGIEGAAAATLISYIFSAYIMMVFFENQRHHFKLATKSLCLPFAIARTVAYVNALNRKSVSCS